MDWQNHKNQSSKCKGLKRPSSFNPIYNHTQPKKRNSEYVSEDNEAILKKEKIEELKEEIDSLKRKRDNENREFSERFQILISRRNRYERNSIAHMSFIPQNALAFKNLITEVNREIQILEAQKHICIGAFNQKIELLQSQLLFLK